LKLLPVALPLEAAKITEAAVSEIDSCGVAHGLSVYPGYLAMCQVISATAVDGFA